MVNIEKPDLILLDLNLPILSGQQVCKKFKADELIKQIPVIVLSASSENIKEVVSDICAQDYIIKPYNVQELLSKIEQYIRK
jgi:DNA-binding response OmpR family regulator